VSFYKGLGAVAGAALAGDEDLVATARVWRHRHGGMVYSLWPYAASALHGLRTRLPRMPAYLAGARRIAAGLAAVEHVEVVPAVPDTAHLQLHLAVDADRLAAAALAMAQEEGIATFASSWAASPRPCWRTVELAVGDATLAMGPDAVVDAITRLVAAARR
jgi:threonine aldolase